VDKLFLGVEWATIAVRPDGLIDPPPKALNRDKLIVKRCWHLAPRTYNIINAQKGYNCFVQFRQIGPVIQARCTYIECVKWRAKNCKHIRAACKWHVKLMRRITALDEQYERLYRAEVEGQPV
jgi:hypothetical protein